MQAKISQLRSCWVLIVLGVSCAVPRLYSAITASAQAVYFVAATPPQNGSPKAYPVALYTVGSAEKLVLVRRFFNASPSQYFMDFADDLHGEIYLAGQSQEGQGLLFVVHKDEPTQLDFVPLAKFSDFPCWGAVSGKALASKIQYCDTNQVIQVLGDAGEHKPRISRGNWLAFKFLQYGGENGGPFLMTPPLAEIAGSDLVMPYSWQPDVVLAQLPPQFSAKPELRQLVWILASTDRYLVVWILPKDMFGGSVDTSNPRHAEPLYVLILDRAINHWRAIELPTTVTSNSGAPVRLFGDWLVTTEMEWRPGPLGSGSGSPGTENEAHGSTDGGVPDVRDEYYNKFLDLYIPGKFVIDNLAENRRFVLNTGQEDSEVLLIGSDGQILYRVNDSIYSAKIVTDQIVHPKLIANDTGVPEIHWAFWGPSADGLNHK
jgi:hypothetical protein